MFDCPIRIETVEWPLGRLWYGSQQPPQRSVHALFEGGAYYMEYDPLPGFVERASLWMQVRR